jgi:hypothetical protein
MRPASDSYDRKKNQSESHGEQTSETRSTKVPRRRQSRFRDDTHTPSVRAASSMGIPKQRPSRSELISTRFIFSATNGQTNKRTTAVEANTEKQTKLNVNVLSVRSITFAVWCYLPCG